MEVIAVKEAKEYVAANYPNDPLLKRIVTNLLDQLPKIQIADDASLQTMRLMRCSAMDNIDRIMKEADRAGFGCSYGKYRAAHPDSIGDAGAAAPKISPKPEKKLQMLRSVVCSKPCKSGLLFAGM